MLTIFVEHGIMETDETNENSRITLSNDPVFNKYIYHAKTEFNNCFIIHFSHNSYSETEAKRSAILFLRRTHQGA